MSTYAIGMVLLSILPTIGYAGGTVARQKRDRSLYLPQVPWQDSTIAQHINCIEQYIRKAIKNNNAQTLATLQTVVENVSSDHCNSRQGELYVDWKKKYLLRIIKEHFLKVE